MTGVIEGQERNEWTDELENTPNEKQLCGKKSCFLDGVIFLESVRTHNFGL